MPVHLFRMPAGIPGGVSRKAQAIIEPIKVAEDMPFGSPIQVDNAGHAVSVYDDQKPIYGFLVRPYPTQSLSDADNSLGAGSAKAGTIQDVLRSGYMTIRVADSEMAKVKKTTPVKVVFTPEGNFTKGECTVSTGTTVDRCMYMGEPDASGNTEIAFNI